MRSREESRADSNVFSIGGEFRFSGQKPGGPIYLDEAEESKATGKC